MSYFGEVNVKNAADTVVNPATEEKQDDSITSTDAISTRIGEVQAAPTANTVLDRLKALLTGIVLAAGSAIIGKVGIDQTTPGTTNGVQVNAELPAGTQLIGKTGIDQTTPGTTNAVSAYMKTGDATYQVPRLDVSTHALQTIEYEHHAIHAGSSFTITFSADVGSGNNHDLLIVTPNTTKWAHLVYEIIVEGEADVWLYEGTTTSAAGTAMTEVNRDFNSGTAATVVVTHTPTVTGVGTIKRGPIYLGSVKSFGGGSHGLHEFILKQNTTYLLRVNNASGSNNRMTAILDWYELTNKTA